MADPGSVAATGLVTVAPASLSRGRSALTRFGGNFATTPGRLSIAMLSVLIIGIAVSAFGYEASRQQTDAVHRMNGGSAPAVISSQRIASSLSEAQTFATSTFLSGVPEDREQRRQYDEAILRASNSLQQTSRLLASNQTASAALESLSVDVIQFAGLIETARTKNAARDSSASTSLRSAGALFDSQILPNLKIVQKISSATFLADETKGTRSRIFPTLGLLALLLVVVFVQFRVFRRFRRFVNLGLAASTVVIVGTLVVVVRGQTVQALEINKASKGGRDPVFLVAAVRKDAYDLQTALNKAIIGTAGSDANDFTEFLDLSRKTEVTDQVDELLDQAPDPRRLAMATETKTRWSRYEDSVTQIVAETNQATRLGLAGTTAVNAFSGFNIAVDSLMAANEVSFVEHLDRADASAKHLPLLFLLAPLVATALAVAGIQQRRKEYR